MTEGEKAESLSATRQLVLVLRIVVEVSGKVSGEIVDPLTEQRRWFHGFESLYDTVFTWIDDALGSADQDDESSKD